MGSPVVSVEYNRSSLTWQLCCFLCRVYFSSIISILWRDKKKKQAVLPFFVLKLWVVLAFVAGFFPSFWCTAQVHIVSAPTSTRTSVCGPHSCAAHLRDNNTGVRLKSVSLCLFKRRCPSSAQGRQSFRSLNWHWKPLAISLCAFWSGKKSIHVISKAIMPLGGFGSFLRWLQRRQGGRTIGSLEFSGLKNSCSDSSLESGPAILWVLMCALHVMSFQTKLSQGQDVFIYLLATCLAQQMHLLKNKMETVNCFFITLQYSK